MASVMAEAKDPLSLAVAGEPEYLGKPDLAREGWTPARGATEAVVSSAISFHFMVGIVKLAPVLAPRGQREVTVLRRVKKRTPSGPCMK